MTSSYGSKYKFGGLTLSVPEWAEKLGISRSAMLLRIKKYGVGPKAMSKGQLPKRESPIRVQVYGEDMKLNTVADMFDIARSTVQEWYKRGYDIESRIEKRKERNAEKFGA